MSYDREIDNAFNSLPVQCSRCDLPLEDCEGHGSSPESGDNEAEKGR